MASSPAFSFYAKDFLTGTATMSLQEVGAYVRLLCYQWDAGRVPADSNERARLLGCAKAQERELWKKVSKKFVLRDDGYFNERLEGERNKQIERRRRLSDNGKLGGRPAKANGKQTESNSFPAAKANGNLNERLSSSSSSSKEQIPPSPERSVLERRFDAWWSAYPRKVQKTAALKAWRKLNPTDAQLEQMLAALEWQRTQPGWLKEGGTFVPYPASYLNTGSYLDEPFHLATDTRSAVPTAEETRRMLAEREAMAGK